MRLTAHIRKSLWGCSCLICHILNAILALIAIAQVGLIGLNLTQQDIPLPDKLAHWVVNKVVGGKFEATWSNAHFDLRGGLLLSKFELKAASSEQIIGTAQEAQIKLSPLYLLTRSLSPLKSIDANGVEIYLPMSHSPTGLNEPVLFIKNASIQEEDGQLIVSSLMVRSGKVQLHLTGTAPIHLLYADSPSGVGPQFLPALKLLRRYTQDQAALAEVHWTLLPSGLHLFSIDAHIPSLKLPQAGMTSLHAKAGLLLSKKGGTITELELTGGLILPENLPKIPMLEDFSVEGPIPFHLSFSGTPMELDWFRIPSHIQLNLKASKSGLPADQLILSTDLDNPTASVSWIATAPGVFATGEALPLSGKSILTEPRQALAISFRSYVEGRAIDDLIPKPAPHRTLVGAHVDFARIDGLLDTRNHSFSGYVLTDGLNIGQTDFDYLRTRVAWADNNLVFTDIRIRKDDDEFAQGSYYHNLETTKFSLNAAGSAVPPSLDGLLGDWWIRIFPNIEATRSVPADVTVWGNWNDKKTLQSITFARAQEAFYRGAHVPKLDIRVRSNRHWAVLEQLSAKYGDASLNGTIAIQLGIGPSDAYRALILDFEGNAPWDVVCKASDVQELGLLKFSEPSPYVTAKGIIWNDSGKGHNAESIADLELSLNQQEGLCEVQGLTMSGLTLDGRIRRQDLLIDSIAGKFAEGVFTGDLHLSDWDNPQSLRKEYRFQLIDAQYGLAANQLAGLMKDSEKVREHLLKGSTEGRLDLEFNLVDGYAGETATGNGSVALRKAKISRIHLFGGLSKALDSMGLGFSSSDLTALSLQWQLANNILSIDKGLVTGPILSLSLSGDVNMQSKQLSMLADLTLFQGVISKVLSPVSENMQFDLGGTMDSPQWGMRINPLRWFQNRITLQKPNPTL